MIRFFFICTLLCWVGQISASMTERNNLYAIKLHPDSQTVNCRTLPFLVMPEQVLSVFDDEHTISVGTKAEALYFLGMVNHGWEYGTAHWGEHPELRSQKYAPHYEVRDSWTAHWGERSEARSHRRDQLHIGKEIGRLHVHYADGQVDTIPIVFGVTSWASTTWAAGFAGIPQPIREPFASRPEFAQVLSDSLLVREDDRTGADTINHAHYYLPYQPADKVITKIVVQNNTDLRGRAIVSGITLKSPSYVDGLHAFEPVQVDEDDLSPTLTVSCARHWQARIRRLSDILYMSEQKIPSSFEPVDFGDLDAASIRFEGGKWAQMLSNIWAANIEELDTKFEQNGFFRESGVSAPWYAGYNGIGTWLPDIGVYSGGAFARCADHFVSLAVRLIQNAKRNDNFVDFVDHWFYFFRNDHDPENGPPNDGFDAAAYPADAPGHWTFILNNPAYIPYPVNEIPGGEEMDGHGAVMVARWLTWRHAGAPTGEWLTAPREEVFGNSRWDTTRDAAEFVCWLMDYTGMDVMWSEGETTGWGARIAEDEYLLIPGDMHKETDPEKIRKNYANSNMYEPYPTFVCMTALQVSAQMAEAMGKPELAERWRSYADRLYHGMLRMLISGSAGRGLTWRVSPNSVYPNHQERLVQAWFTIYFQGLDPDRLDQRMLDITRNTYAEQVALPTRLQPALAMGYGMGWLTKTAMILDEMDDAGVLLQNIARYVYDHNMDYVSDCGTVDWREHMWIVPEGVNILPNGYWHRIGDLSNGANQGPSLHAIELAAGVDDTDPNHVRLMPRIPQPLTGIEVKDFPILVDTPKSEGYLLGRAMMSYNYNRSQGRFTLTSDTPIPHLSIRFGPFDHNAAHRAMRHLEQEGVAVRLQQSGTYQKAPAYWVWADNLKDVDELVFSVQ